MKKMMRTKSRMQMARMKMKGSLTAAFVSEIMRLLRLPEQDVGVCQPDEDRQVAMAIGTRIFSSSRFSKRRFMKYRSTSVDLIAAMARTMRMPTRPKFRLAVVTVMAVRTTRASPDKDVARICHVQPPR